MTETRFAEMISKIAHELRSPLTSIKGFSATLVKRWDRFSEEQRLQFVETIHADAERMGRIISEVLDLARLEAGRLELSSTDANVAAATERAIVQVAQMPGGERVVTDVPDDVTAWADVERLERVIANLIENAVKFSETGPIEVTARSDGERTTITVSDRGIGIEPERLESVFAGPGPSGQIAGPRGTGLGLHLAKRIAEAYGGSLSVESELGRGSTFTLVLPAKMKDTAA
ncbi:MAG: HAMP domain-containing histidine kinase [Actinomycetota bacterium]|nr:HAMP domain-containing histidine kinase [Actinomycetota bacterium]